MTDADPRDRRNAGVRQPYDATDPQRNRPPWKVTAVGFRRSVVAACAIALILSSTLVAGPALADEIYPPDAGQTIDDPPPTNGIGQYHPIAPTRLLDTRFGIGGPTGRIASGTSRVVDVTKAPIPTTDVAAVAVNVTVTGATVGGYLTLYPTGTTRPTASSLNYGPGQTIANMTIIKLGATGNIRVYAAGSTHVIVDVVGWYHASTPAHGHVGATLYNPLPPARILDTRYGIGAATGRVAGGTSRLIDVTGLGGVPGSGVSAVALNITVTGSSHAGFLTLYPSGTTRPTTSNINHAAGQTIANMALVKVGTDGKIRLYAENSTHVIFDVVGWFAPDDPDAGGEMSPVSAKRIVDTRYGIGGSTGRLAAGTSRLVDVTGVGGVPANGVAAVKLNVTVTSPTRSGYLTLYPSGTTAPTASNVNYATGQTIAAMSIVKVGADGKIRVFASSATHVIVDVIGFYAAVGASLADETALGPQGVITTAGEPPTPAALAVGASGEVHHVESPRTFTEALADSGTDIAAELDGAFAPEPRHPGNPVITSPFFHTDSAGYVGGHQSIGRIYFKTYAGEVNWHFCTGTIVARNLVLTAGHCVAKAGTYFTEWYFIPGLNGSLTSAIATYGEWTATDAVTPNLWRFNGNYAGDWAFLMFGNVPANGNQYIGDVLGKFDIHADPPGGTKISYGYPAEGWFASNNFQACSFDSCVMYQCTSRVTDSNTQYLQTLVDPGASYGGWYEVGFGCWSTGGASGGPIFQLINNKWWVTGVNSHIETDAQGTFTCSTRPSTVCFDYARNLWSPYFNGAGVITMWFAHRVP